ncbi:MAG: 3-deoxy-manno-octulosonate cytidylyltransferase [Alphaproteobacteria bacterium]
MTWPEDTIVLIPARRAATRLPGKPLATIGTEPMIVHVWRRAIEAEVGPVIVATDDADIVAAVEAVGGKAELTSPDHPSGSDRINEVLERLDPDCRIEYVLNLQGDLPTLTPDLVRRPLEILRAGNADITTLAAIITDPAEAGDPGVVKAVAALGQPGSVARAHYFTRALAPHGPGPVYHHIGIYAYRRAALKRFVCLPPSPLECREKLEQLRALEDGMRIDVGLVDTVPIGVDTPADLERARSHHASETANPTKFSKI